MEVCVIQCYVWSVYVFAVTLSLSLCPPDESLSPYTEYQYAVRAVNGAGSTLSDYTVTTTTQALPAGVTPPTPEVRPSQLDTIYLTWDPPQQPNGKGEISYWGPV